MERKGLKNPGKENPWLLDLMYGIVLARSNSTMGKREPGVSGVKSYFIVAQEQMVCHP
jgi:hypothetical protein